MTVSLETPECKIFKTFQGYVARLHVPDDDTNVTTQPTVLPTPILIVDISGSMGQHAGKLIRKVLPDTLQQLKYTDTAPVHLITFTNSAVHTRQTIATLRQYGRFSQGGTNMSQVPTQLQAILKPSANGYLILTVSDGHVTDQGQTQKNASQLATSVKSLAASITSHAIRFDTGGNWGGGADTRALSSLLQLDNTGLEVSVKDIKSNWDDALVVSTLLEAISRDGKVTLSSSPLEVTGGNVRRYPWETSSHNVLPVTGHDDIFWLDNIPTGMTLNGENVTLLYNDEFLDRGKYQVTLGKYLDGFLQRAKVLKVVATETAESQLVQMLTYFEGLERTWAVTENVPTEDDKALPPLVLRSKQLRRAVQKGTLSIRNRLNAIINDNKVTSMNASQQADYLRTVDVSKNAKGLAKRAASSTGAFDFDTETRREVRAMHTNISELKDVDDTNHMASFYSRATTLDGIKTVCELVDDGTLDAVSTAQVIELLNIVGFPCDAPIGDYPDPMTYRINEVFPLCNVSLADVLVYTTDSQGQHLETPATGRRIHNVVPVFEDDRIVQFLRKHAPTLMEYVASVGMRRIIADVPMTMGYTIIAGVWKMMETLGEGEASEVAIRTFLHMLNQLPVTVGRAFAHTLPLLDHPNDDKRVAYHLLHNGVTNMLVALLHGIKEKKRFDMPKLLRALYSFEVWQAVRKLYRHTEGECDRMIRRLFAVDFDKWRVPVSNLFEPDVASTDVAETWPADIDREYATETLKSSWYVDILTYIPDMFSIATNDSINMDEKIAEFKRISFNDEKKARLLAVPDWTAFRETALLQALTFTTKKSRVDEKTELPILPDPSCQEETDSLRKRVLREVYLEQYRKDLAEKAAKEDKVLIEDLVDKLLTAPDLSSFVSIVNSGVSRGTRVMKLNNPSSQAFQALYPALFTAGPASPIPAHGEKMAFIVAGVTQDGSGVWNNGNLLLPIRKTWYDIFKAIDREDLWSYLKKLQRERVHRYREGKGNRHSHDNEKPSYWAMGYATMDVMKDEVDADTFKDYLKVHSGCCGSLNYV